jgi:hypothetical protein
MTAFGASAPTLETPANVSSLNSPQTLPGQ